MRVVFLEDVEGVAQGGDVKEVKNGFARNFLIPKNLAVPATHNALQQIESISQRAEEDRTRNLTDLRAVADALEGTLINIEMRSGVNNRLYGSVTNAVLADELSKITAKEIDRRTLIMAEPIRELGLFEVTLRLHQDVEVPISVLVYPIGADPKTALAIAKGEAVAEETSEETADSSEEASEEAADEEESSEDAEEADVEEQAEEEGAASEDEAEASVEEDAAEEETSEDAEEADVEEQAEEEEAASEDEAEAGVEEDATEEEASEEAKKES